MQFCEKRYTETMIIQLKVKRNLAERFGGKVAYFERLIAQWEGMDNEDHRRNSPIRL